MLRLVSFFLLFVILSNVISPSVTLASVSPNNIGGNQSKLYFHQSQLDQIDQFFLMGEEDVISEIRNGKIINLNNQNEYIENRCTKISNENCEMFQLIYYKDGLGYLLTKEISLDEMRLFLRKIMKQIKFMLRDIKRNERNQYELDKKRLFEFVSSVGEDLFDDDHLIGLMIMLIFFPIGAIAIAFGITYLALALCADLVVIPYKLTHNVIVKMKMNRRVKHATQMFERIRNALIGSFENNEIISLEENDFHVLLKILTNQPRASSLIWRLD